MALALAWDHPHVVILWKLERIRIEGLGTLSPKPVSFILQVYPPFSVDANAHSSSQKRMSEQVRPELSLF